MLIARSEPLHCEILKWIAIYLLAAATAIALAS
jgi:hypothetical protein